MPLLNQNTGNIATAKARETQAEVSLNVALREVERKVASQLHAYDTLVAEILTRYIASRTGQRTSRGQRSPSLAGT